MSFTINTNVAAVISGSQVNRNYRAAQNSQAKLATGRRLVSAREDAAAFGVSENLKAHQRSSKVALNNINDGISLIRTAEGSTNEAMEIVKRMRELAIQSSSETLNSVERSYIQDEFVSSMSEIDRIVNASDFNGQRLIDGQTPSYSVQAGVNNNSNDRVTITMGDVSVLTLGVHTSQISLGSLASAQAAILELDQALDTLNGYRADYGSVSNKLDYAYSALEVYNVNVGAAASQISDVDFAVESARSARLQIMQQAGLSVLAQSQTASQASLGLL